jgi:Peptidase family M23
MSRHRTTAAVLLALLTAGALAGTAGAEVPRLVFPIVAETSYVDDFGAPRGSGRHQGNDLMAAKRSPVVAVESGRVLKYRRSSAAGCMLYLYGRSGTTYMYIHLNNDRTLRNDNRGGCRNGIAYARGLQSNQRVRAGQLIAYVGDSGDANGIASHLHFELHPNGGRAVSPYNHLRRAHKHLYPRPLSGEADTAWLRIRGRVIETNLETDPQRIRLKIIRLRLSGDLVVEPARNVTLSVPSHATVRRTTTERASVPITLAGFEQGDRVVAWTDEFPETVRSARGAAGRHTVTDLLRLLRK